MFGLAVVLVLASHGDQGAREDKFRGALTEGRGESVQIVDRVAALRELDNRVAERPSFFGCGIAVSVGGPNTLVGAVSLSILGALSVTSASGIILLVVGMTCVPVGILVSLVAGFVMIGVATDQRVFDERIRVLRRHLQQPVEPPIPPPVVMAPSPVVLARF